MLGATGTSKTVGQDGDGALADREVQKSSLIIAHNKTLAAQLCKVLRLPRRRALRRIWAEQARANSPKRPGNSWSKHLLGSLSGWESNGHRA